MAHGKTANMYTSVPSLTPLMWQSSSNPQSCIWAPLYRSVFYKNERGWRI